MRIHEALCLLGQGAQKVLSQEEVQAISGQLYPDGIIRNAGWWK